MSGGGQLTAPSFQLLAVVNRNPRWARHPVDIFLELTARRLIAVFERDIDILMGMIGTVALNHNLLTRHVNSEMNRIAVSLCVGCMGSFHDDMTTCHAVEGFLPVFAP